MNMFHWVGLGLLWAGTCAQAQVPTHPTTDTSSQAEELEASSAAAAPTKTALPWNFVQVDPGVFRGPEPSPAMLEDLRKKGVKTIINLQWPSKNTEAERKRAESMGFHYVAQPISALPQTRVNDAQTRSIIALMGDPANQPVYVHCLAGEDRTGLMIGLYRVAHDHWTPQAAFSEMEKYKFHRYRYHNLTEYFRKYTGYKP